MSGMDLFGSEERKEVMDVLDTTCLFRYNQEDLRQGVWKAKELEHEVGKFTKAPFVHAVSSGSTAVSTMLAAAGIGFGDEVIVPPFTFVAPIEAVLLAGALPVFAEIDETLCLSAEGIQKAITPKTKAVLLVHMCGAAASMDAIIKVCREHNLILLEDAGQAFGAFYKGKSVGLFGAAGSFSFDFFKINTMGEGGMLITNDENTHRLMQQISDHGHSHVGNVRGMEPHPVIGLNYRASELNAAIGLAQVRKVEAIIAKNKEIKKILKNALSDFNDVSFRTMDDPQGDSATFLNFFVKDAPTAQKIMDEAKKAGVPGFNYWYTNMYHFINQWDHIKELRFPAKLAIHHLGAPQDYNHLQLPKSQEVVGRLISISIKSNLKMGEAVEFGEAVASVLNKI